MWYNKYRDYGCDNQVIDSWRIGDVMVDFIIKKC